MRSMLVGISALVLVGSASANAAVSLVGTDVTITYLSPTATSVFAGPTVLPITTDPTTLDCPAFGSGVCAAFVENAAITIGADSFTVVEDSGSSYATEPFNGIQFSNLDFGPGEKITGFSLLTNLPGLTAADISFTNDSIMYNASGLSFETEARKPEHRHGPSRKLRHRSTDGQCDEVGTVRGRRTCPQEW
jgi:hypothetical protein